jgi:hypothetical protein
MYLPLTIGYFRESGFHGLVFCGHCGCALTAEIKKGRYVYYHCTGYKGKCPEKYVREEEMARSLFASLNLQQIGIAGTTGAFQIDEGTPSSHAGPIFQYKAGKILDKVTPVNGNPFSLLPTLVERFVAVSDLCQKIRHVLMLSVTCETPVCHSVGTSRPTPSSFAR